MRENKTHFGWERRKRNHKVYSRGLTPFLFFLCVLFSCSLLTNLANGQSKPAQGYQVKQILFLKFGTGNSEKEVGVLGNPYCGPGALAIDKSENIYLTDPGNKRILIYSNKGDFIKSVQSDSDRSVLEVNDNGDIYTTYFKENKYKVLKIKSTGEKIKTDQTAGIIYNDTLFGSDGSKRFFFESNEKPSMKFNEPLLLKKDFYQTYGDKKDKNHFVNIRTEKIKRIVHENNVVLPNFIKIPLAGKNQEELGWGLDWKILGFDDTGNIYLLLGILGKYPHVLKEEKIQIFSLHGNLISEIPLDLDACFSQALNPLFFKVDKQGNVFQLLNTQKGVYVFEWVKQQN